MIVLELLDAPPQITVRVHEELPRDPSRPYFVQTRPIDHVYVRADTVAALQREQKNA